jgi:hypothetical protein
MAERKVEVMVDEVLFRRAAARAADLGQDLGRILVYGLAGWVGSWGVRTVTHTVRSGESLGGIAKIYYGDAKKATVIAIYNDIKNPSMIHAGQTLIVPEPTNIPTVPAPEPLPKGESPFIFGLHDRGGEYLMAWANHKGWVLCTEELGRNPANWGSRSYADLADGGFGVIARLNHGYREQGTLPRSEYYHDFAVRCGNFVERSNGCHIWIIGNEPNLAVERPGGPANGEPVTPDKYVSAFSECREEIRRRPGHDTDQVVMAAVGPWNVQTTYPGNLSGDWVVYFQNILEGLDGALDGIAIHTYARDADPANLSSDARMDAPFQHRRKMFRTYVDFAEAIPLGLGNLPLYLTETNQNIAWANTSTGWIQEAYAEISRWNDNPLNQKIRCALLYRWEKHDMWYLKGKNRALDDFREALQHDYRWRD